MKINWPLTIVIWAITAVMLTASIIDHYEERRAEQALGNRLLVATDITDSDETHIALRDDQIIRKTMCRSNLQKNDFCLISRPMTLKQLEAEADTIAYPGLHWQYASGESRSESIEMERLFDCL